MKYIESAQLKEKPKLYTNIKETLSWIMRDPFIFDYFDKKVPRDAKILELGCGKGYFLDRLDEKGFRHLHGADIANYLNNKKYPHQAVDLNVERLEHPDNSLDVVTAFQIIEHLENYFLVMQEAARVLKPGGLFVFSIPNPHNIFYRFKFALTGNMTGFDLKNNHLLFVTRDVFQKTYLKHFDIMETYYDKGPIPMLGRLNVLPGVNFPPKVKVLPRSEAFAYKTCYFLRKKS